MDITDAHGEVHILCDSYCARARVRWRSKTTKPLWKLTYGLLADEGRDEVCSPTEQLARQHEIIHFLGVLCLAYIVNIVVFQSHNCSSTPCCQQKLWTAEINRRNVLTFA